MRNPSGLVRAFTMIELLVAIGLMVMLLSVLTFVFRQSAEAVSGATETVNVVQKARNFASRLGKEVGAAVEYYLPGKPPVLAFSVFDSVTSSPAESGRMIEFLSQTTNEGILDTWCVRYYYVPETDEGKDTETGTIYRLVRPVFDKDGKPTFRTAPSASPTVGQQGEVIARPVRNVIFRRVPPPPTRKDQADEIPASVEVIATFLDTWGGRRFVLPQQFYFPVYQGH